MFPFPPSARISVWHKVFGQGLHVESRPTYMYIKPNLLWMKLWTPLFPNFIAVSFRHLTIMYLYFKHLTISYQYAKQDSQNSSIHCNFTSFKKKKIINWEQGRYKNIFEIAVGETALFAVLSKWLWQGGQPMCQRALERGSTCLSLPRSACLLVHTLSPSQTFFTTKLRTKHKDTTTKLTFLKNLQREMQTSCTVSVAE